MSRRQKRTRSRTVSRLCGSAGVGERIADGSHPSFPSHRRSPRHRHLHLHRNDHSLFAIAAHPRVHCQTVDRDGSILQGRDSRRNTSRPGSWCSLRSASSSSVACPPCSSCTNSSPPSTASRKVYSPDGASHFSSSRRRTGIPGLDARSCRFGPIGVSALYYAILAREHIPENRVALHETVWPVVIFMAMSSTIVHVSASSLRL